MEILLRGYEVNQSTWFYLSCLLILAVFYRFGRIFSVRNFDLVLLVSIAPGLLVVPHRPTLGYGWLFVVSALLLLRSLFDSAMVRRPQIRPNLNVAGLTFLCASASVFLMTQLLTESPAASEATAIRPIGDEALETAKSAEPRTPEGPASRMLTAGLVEISRATGGGRWNVELVAARILVVLAHLSVIVGLILVGRRLFGDHETGIAMATLYMLLPCTAYDVGKATHVLPAALVIWAILAYRRPVVSGMLLGLACGILFFPMLLLPLWCVFYGWRGSLRFLAAVGLVAGVILSIQFLMAPDASASVRQVLAYLELDEFQLNRTIPQTLGFWQQDNAVWRIPVVVSYLVMVMALVLWPRKKHLGHLIAHSAATIIGVQLWYAQQGGIYVLWYLPLVLLLVFRPALSQHAAPEIAPLRWLGRSRSVDQPAPAALASFSRLQWRS